MKRDTKIDHRLTEWRTDGVIRPWHNTLRSAESGCGRIKIILPHITNNISLPEHQHGFRQHRSTTTALHHINNTITTGFNIKQPPQRTIAIALDMSKAFDTVNLHTLIHKLHNTNIPNTIIKLMVRLRVSQIPGFEFPGWIFMNFPGSREIFINSKNL